MRRLVVVGSICVFTAACQRGGEGSGGPAHGGASSGIAAGQAAAGYAAEPTPGPEAMVGKGAAPPPGFAQRLDRAEAGAPPDVTQPRTVTGRITGAGEDSVNLETSSGEHLVLLLPPPQEAYRSGLSVGSPGELRAGDEVRATYRVSQGGQAVADSIEVTKPVNAKK
jgi:hypothetical protein